MAYITYLTRDIMNANFDGFSEVNGSSEYGKRIH